ncbi:MAG: hypothetical protein ACP5RT_00835 [Candidatus Micrarchaeia archaeon]
MIGYILLSTGAYCLSSINSFLTAPYTAWFPVASILALVVISILSIIYILAPLFGKEDIRSNIKISIYQTLFSLVLIISFGIFSTWVCTFNMQGLLSIIGIAPNFVPTGANVYLSAVSNLYYFLNKGPLANLNNLILGFFVNINSPPLISIEVTPIPGIPGVGFKDTLAFSLSGPIDSLTSYLTQSLSWLFILNYLQFILISSAPILFAIFIALGLISRIFGPTRSFGGALIALGIGIGFVYPLMVSITYGFINVSYTQLYNDISGYIYQSAFGSTLETALENLLMTGKAISNAINAYVYSYLDYVGFTVVSSLILPMINFIVVDTFIIDFSSAFGEKMSFISLLTKIV